MFRSTKGFPGSYDELMIVTEQDGITFWSLKTLRDTLFLDLYAYNFKKYRFTKVNDQSVSSGEELRKAINSLKKGDHFTLTLAKRLFSQGVQFSSDIAFLDSFSWFLQSFY